MSINLKTMLRQILTITTLFLICHCLKAQPSLSEQIESMIIKADEISQSHFDSSIHILNQALLKSRAADSPRLVFLTHRAMGFIYEDNNRLNEAQKEYATALKLAEAQLLVDDQLMIYTDWAILHKKLGEYKIAGEYHLRTIEWAEKISNWEMAENGYNGLGTMYSFLGNYQKAIYYYLESIRAAEKWGNKEGVVLTEQNISDSYLKAGNYEMALKNIAKTYNLAIQLGDSIRVGAVLKVYGDIKVALKDYPEALAMLSRAQAIFVKKGDKTRLAECYLSIGEVYCSLNQLNKADAYMDSCMAFVNFLSPYSSAEYYLQKESFAN